jgi:hypothetical protein
MKAAGTCPAANCFGSTRLFVDELQVHRLRPAAATVVFRLERKLGALRKLLQAGALDRRDMHEDVLAAALWRDEAKAAIVVKEFQGAVLAWTALAWLSVPLKAATPATAAAASEATAAASTATAITTATTAFAIAATTVSTAAATAAAVIAATATAAAITAAATSAATITTATAVTIATATIAAATAPIAIAAASARRCTMATPGRVAAEISLSAKFALPAASGHPVAVPLLATITKLVLVAAVLTHTSKSSAKSRNSLSRPQTKEKALVRVGARFSKRCAVLGEESFSNGREIKSCGPIQPHQLPQIEAVARPVMHQPAPSGKRESRRSRGGPEVEVG